MTYAHAVVLGLVQGLTEFLPVSSSGHLILVPYFFGWPDQGLAFDAALHLGTLAALLAYFRTELIGMATGALSRGVILVLAVATVPAVVVGLAFGTGHRDRAPLATAHRGVDRVLGRRDVDRRPAGEPPGRRRAAGGCRLAPRNHHRLRRRRWP